MFVLFKFPLNLIEKIVKVPNLLNDLLVVIRVLKCALSLCCSLIIECRIHKLYGFPLLVSAPAVGNYLAR